MNHVYENKYGRLEFKIVAPYQKVSTINSKDIDDSLFFTIDDAEKIALITENRHIQIVFCYPNLKKAYLLHHSSCSVCAPCKIISLDFDNNIDARAVLALPLQPITSMDLI